MDKIKGYLFGFAASLAGVALWVFLANVLGIIAGIAGAVMGILFLLVYKKMTGEEKSSVITYIIGGVIILVDIFLAEIISLAIVGASYDVGLAELMAYSEIQSAMLQDILVGLLLSMLVYVGYIVSLNRKANQALAKNKVRTDAFGNTVNDVNNTGAKVVESYTAADETAATQSAEETAAAETAEENAE